MAKEVKDKPIKVTLWAAANKLRGIEELVFMFRILMNNQESFLHGFECDVDWQISKRLNFLQTRLISIAKTRLTTSP